jgi:succinate dehydrogenase (ubiquinone) membrane anchor subunit
MNTLVAVLKGTVNDATTFPEPVKSHGSYHWTFERVLSAALIPIMGGAAVSSGSAYVRYLSIVHRFKLTKPNTIQPILDAALGISLVIHSHIGFDSCLVDYVHPRKFKISGPLGKWILRVATGLSVWGVYEFNTNDIGKSRRCLHI